MEGDRFSPVLAGRFYGRRCSSWKHNFILNYGRTEIPGKVCLVLLLAFRAQSRKVAQTASVTWLPDGHGKDSSVVKGFVVGKFELPPTVTSCLDGAEPLIQFLGSVL